MHQSLLSVSSFRMHLSSVFFLTKRLSYYVKTLNSLEPSFEKVLWTCIFFSELCLHCYLLIQQHCHNEYCFLALNAKMRGKHIVRRVNESLNLSLIIEVTLSHFVLTKTCK